MGLISPGGQNLLDFLELRQVFSTYDGERRDPLVASGKDSPHANCSRASLDSFPFDAGAKDLVWMRDQNLRIPLQCLHGYCGTSGVFLGE